MVRESGAKKTRGKFRFPGVNYSSYSETFLGKQHGWNLLNPAREFDFAGCVKRSADTPGREGLLVLGALHVWVAHRLLMFL